MNLTATRQAAAGEAARTAHPDSVPPASTLHTVQAIYQAFGQGDIAAILAVLDDEVQWDVWHSHSAQQAGTPHLQPRLGRDGVAAFFQSLADLEFHDFKVLGLSGDAHQVAAEIQIDFSARATGRRVQDEELHLWTFGPDGRVRRLRHYVDTAKHAWVHGLTPRV